MKSQAIATVLATCMVALAADAAPPQCPSETVRRWAQLRERMAAAPEASMAYLPFPFPKSDAQVIADFEYGYLRKFGSDGADLPNVEQELLRGVKEQTNRYVVLRVENWGSQRCSSPRRGAYEFLVRVFNKLSGDEIARWALLHSGLPAQGSYPPADDETLLTWWSSDIPDLESVVTQADSSFGFKASRPIYVSLEGQADLRCDPTHPCVAFQVGERTLVRGRLDRTASRRGDEPSIYEIRTSSKHEPSELTDQASRQGLMEGLDPVRELLVSYGQDGFCVARRLDGTTNQAPPEQ